METDGTVSALSEKAIWVLVAISFLFLMVYLLCLFSLLSCLNTCIKRKSTLSESCVN